MTTTTPTRTLYASDNPALDALLAEWGLPTDTEAAETIRLIVSELATNAVQHTFGQSPTFTVDIELHRDEQLRIGVQIRPMQSDLAEIDAFDPGNENQRAGAVAFGARGDGRAAFQLANEPADAHGGQHIAADAVEKKLRRGFGQFVGEIGNDTLGPAIELGRHRFHERRNLRDLHDPLSG